MTNKIMLSIIIPIYNGEEYLQSTLAEIMKIQHIFEIILIDDGSTDGSYTLCKKKWGNDNKIHIYTKKNGGIVESRNLGLDKVKGKYVIFVDQDDLVISKSIDYAIDIAEQSNIDMVFWSTCRILKNKEKIPCGTVLDNIELSESEIKNTLITDILFNTKNKYITYLGHVWAALYRTDFLQSKNIRFKRFVDIEDDYLFVFDCLLSASSISMIKEIGYCWSYNKKSETYRQKYIDNILERYSLLYQYIHNQIIGCKDIKVDIDKYRTYFIQDSIVRSVENICTYLNKNTKEKKQLYFKIRNNYKEFKNGSIVQYSKRRKRVFFLLRHRLIIVSYIYIFFDSLLRRILQNLFKQGGD